MIFRKCGTDFRKFPVFEAYISFKKAGAFIPGNIGFFVLKPVLPRPLFLSIKRLLHYLFPLAAEENTGSAYKKQNCHY